MNEKRGALKSQFLSAILGGTVVAALGLAAISAGWVKAESSTTTAVAAPLANPVSDSSGDDAPASTVNQIYERDGAGIAFISATSDGSETTSSTDPFGFGTPQQGGTATGSGFVIDSEGHIVTNNHVVAQADEITVTLGDSERTYEATLVGRDPTTDLALLDVEAPADQLHPLTLGRSADIEVGDPVVAIGNPFGLDSTVTSGIVSALQRQIQAPNGRSISDVIQTDAAINPGNSGGPLINAAGEVIGINSQIATGGSSEGNVGIGFAVPVDTAREVISQLLDDGEVEHAFLGISGATIDPTLAEALNLPVQQGVLIQDVVEGGPAAEAGLRTGDTQATIAGAQVALGGDIVTAIGGRRVSSMEDLVDIVNGSDPGDTLELSLLRDGDERSAMVTLGDGG